VRAVHFLNQFFGGLGGEEKANLPVQVVTGAVGPGRALQQALGEEHQIAATIISGDNYLNEEKVAAIGAVKRALSELRPDLVLAGPAMNAGRYGLACGLVCVAAQEMGIPAVSGMHPENPGVLEFRRRVLIVPTGDTPADMVRHLQTMARLGVRVARDGDPGPADESGYIPTGARRLGLREKPAAVRVADMLAARLHGRPFQTELPIEMPDQVVPAAPVTATSSALIALVTTGGLVPRGNPDKLVRGGAKEYFKYSIAGLDSMTPDRWECVHRGFFTDIVNQNPNYILPLNLIRDLERRSEIGSVHGTYFSTSGVGTAVADSKRIGAQIAGEMKEAGVQAAVMVAT